MRGWAELGALECSVLQAWDRGQRSMEVMAEKTLGVGSGEQEGRTMLVSKGITGRPFREWFLPGAPPPQVF